MRHVAWTDDGVEVVETEPPPLPDGWIRLAVTGCGICGSDLHLYRGMRDGVLSPADFAVPGHEIAGQVIGGPAGTIDGPYAVEPWVNCRDCPSCLQGRPMLCPDGLLLGVTAGGGLSDHVDVPPRLLHPVPDGVADGVASMAEPWAVAVRAAHRAGPLELDERVLVLGGGSIGLLCGLALRDRASVVGITCRHPHQADLARAIGLAPIDEADLDRWADQHGPGVVIETVGGEADTVADAVRVARPGGRIVVVGVFGQPRPTDHRALVLKELEIVGSFIYGSVGTGSEFGAAVRAMAPVAGELAALQTHRFDLADAPAAFATADDKSSLAVKVTIEPGTAGSDGPGS